MTETPARVAAMTDRELDALLAEHLFKWSRVFAVGPSTSMGFPPAARHGFKQRREVPGYSSTPSGASAVREAMGERGYEASMFMHRSHDPGQRYDCRFFGGSRRDLGRGMAYSDNEPRATAEAAALALVSAGEIPTDALTPQST